MTSGSLPLYCFNLQLLLFIVVNNTSIYLFSVYLYLSHDRIRTPFLTNADAIIPILPSPQHTQYGVTIGEKVTSAGWQATLCDLIWHVSSRSGVAG